MSWFRAAQGQVAAFLCGALLGGVAALAQGGDDLAALKEKFRRPAAIPFPSSNSYSEAKRALGETLFHDKRLSADGSTACATCHDRQKGFSDGRVTAVGVPGRPLARHTPTLWNLAWAGPVFWDGRARSLEEQVAGPIVAPDEMAQPIAPLIARLAADKAYARAFARAFPNDPRVNEDNLKKAIATYERTLVSPPTRFDRWIAGEASALSAQEADGFRLFTGKAGCANCHSGWAFTDYAFYDVGLPSDDRGRGAVLRLEAAEYAFKTPSLREAARRAPYMHDGSLATLEDVVRHYAGGVTERPTLPRDLTRGLTLDSGEQAALVAFLKTLTSEGDSQPPATIVAEKSAPVAATRATSVSQHDKTFTPTRVRIRIVDKLWILNNDTRTHNIRVFDQKLDFDSGAQEPGETVEMTFPKTGSYLVFCGIHPKMELHVDVAR
ncbi:MAG: cytochrome c peroxidase [Hyphomicrobiales bacterium]|nr:cytochrome c peroxidase [Hyphomicrobiales bacterium]